MQTSSLKTLAFVVTIFFFIILGLSEAYWLAYPFFVHTVSGTAFRMGLVLTLSAVLISAVTFLVNWLSDVKMACAEFAVIGATLYAAWYSVIAFASTMHEIVALSLLSGLASAFTISWLLIMETLSAKNTTQASWL